VSSSITGTGTGTVQTTLPDLDLPRLERTLSELRDLIGYRTYDVTLMLVDDDEMRRTNLETRGIDAPTDVLSFPFQDAVEIGTGEGEGGGGMTTAAAAAATTRRRRTPGVLADPEFDVPDYYSLGEMMVDVPYVIRRCEEDLAAGAVGGDGDGDGDERGVSGAMATVADPEERIHMLLVHGMLHLVGYDHIEDQDYWPMVEREEELLAALRERGLLRGG
jgi:ssRNA-specific RNase YbeY (16S rRNA maturation enzyme)